METNTSSYRQILKATSIFGSVQVFNIAVSIIRSKIIAVLLGPFGMGIAGLLNSTTGLIGGITNFGLGTSAVKNVAAANSAGDNRKVGLVVGVLRRLVWITGLLGSVTTILLSPWLSQITFGNRDYTVAFIWISITLLLNQISTGQSVILTGTRQLKYMARSSLSGSILGLLVSVPVYYLWGIDGIVPAIILTSFASLFRTWYFSRKVRIEKVEITNEDIEREGKEMLTMGFMLSLSGLISLGASYLIRIYISNIGGVEQVGLYAAGFTIINTYVGMIFTAMVTDYFPRLSGVAQDISHSNELINQQAEIAILILAPIITMFLVYINWVVILLYSQKFAQVNGMIQWAALGVFFKAASWPVGFLLLAKGASKVFFWSELISNIYFLIFNILGYKYFGLNGLGISFLISYIFILVQVFLITKVKYQFSFNRKFYGISGIQLLLGLLCFIVVRVIHSPWTYILGSAIVIISISYSLKELEARIALLRSIKGRFRNYRK